MKIILFLGSCLFLTFSFAQMNLIKNHSFEDVNQDVVDDINNAESIYYHHFASESGITVFKCWEYAYVYDPTNWSNPTYSGLVYGILPDFFPTYSGNQYIPNLAVAQVFTDTQGDDDRICSVNAANNSNPFGLRLQTAPNGNEGFDCSPPTTKFAYNTDAFNGSNYVAFFDYRASTGNLYPFFGSKLKEPLAEDAKYRFELSAAQMNRIGEIANLENWNQTKEPRIRVYVTNDDYEQKQEIMDIEFDHNDWQTYVSVFEADKNSTRILIDFNELGEISLFSIGNPALSGCFIDNLKLFEFCEDQYNECLNQNYRLDMLDVELQNSVRADPLALPDPNTNNNEGLLETVKADNLENVQRFEMKIFAPGGSLVRVIDEWYPPSEYIFDGRDDGGNQLPESSGAGNGNKYKAVINAVSNTCYHNSYVDEKYFHLRREYTVFDALISTSLIDVGTVPRITGLDNVHHLKMRLTQNGSNVYEEIILNPPSDIALSTAMHNSNGVPVVMDGQYQLDIWCSNNCEENRHFSSTVSLIDLNNYQSSAYLYLFDWTPVSKPDYECPFVYNYVDNYLAPRDCCEGSLYIDNVEINTSWGVNILNDIYIGANTTFHPSSTNSFAAGDNILYAGQSISIDPSGNSVEFGGNVYLYPGAFNCVPCLIQEEGGGIGNLDEDRWIAVDNPIASDSAEFVLSPNPLTARDQITIRSNSKIINEDVRISMYSALGSEVPVAIKSIEDNQVRFKSKIQLAEGVYFVNIESKGYYQHFTIRINP